MREPRGQFAKIADTITGTMRRRQRDREPRIVVYDASGHPRLVPPEAPGHDRALLAADQLVEAAEKLVVLATGRDQPEESPE